MIQTHQEIACNMGIDEMLAQEKETTHRKGKVDFYLFETVFNECTMILEGLKTLCRAFVDNNEMAGELPDLALVHISHGYDALQRVWDKAMEQQKASEIPTTDTPEAKE